MQSLDEADHALLDLLTSLAGQDYRFITITPASHQRVLRRRPYEEARSTADVLGWSRPFRREVLPAALLEHLRVAGMLSQERNIFRTSIRVSTVRGHHYVHSAYPTSDEDSVFLGPDSYRFADLIADELRATPTPTDARIVDIGVGAGVGAITAATCCSIAEVVGTDVNAKALRFARINAAAAGCSIETIETSGLAGVAGPFDLALLNPPYIIDEDGRAYRHGGGMHGGQLSLDLATEALARLRPHGRLILYTGSAIVGGEDRLKQALESAAQDANSKLRYWELDPDVFGEELSNPQYAEVDRIALVAGVFTKD